MTCFYYICRVATLLVVGILLCLIPTVHSSTDTEDLNALKLLGKDIAALDSTHAPCKLINIGKGWGMHTLCDYPPDIVSKLPHNHALNLIHHLSRPLLPRPNMTYADLPPHLSAHRNSSCRFISFGISTDYSFDTHFYNKYQCSGLALDPSITHPRDLVPGGVTFLKAGANVHVKTPEEWITWSVPALRKVWGARNLLALKMDCEGCEYSLAYDIEQDDPHFFDHIVQFNVEIHVPKTFMVGSKELIGLGKLYRLLQASGLKLVHLDDGRCGADTQRTGCQQELFDAGIACDPGCRSFLFARIFT